MTSLIILSFALFYQSLARNFQGFLWSFIVQFSRFRFTQKLSFELSSLLRDSLFIISHLFKFVKYFFQLFSNSFFDVILELFSSRFVCLSRRELLYHITYISLCQDFFLLLDNCTASWHFLSNFSDRVHKRFALSDFCNYYTLFYTPFTLYIYTYILLPLRLYTFPTIFFHYLHSLSSPKPNIHITHMISPAGYPLIFRQHILYDIPSHSYDCQMPLPVVLPFSFYYMYLFLPLKQAFVYIDQSIC